MTLFQPEYDIKLDLRATTEAFSKGWHKVSYSKMSTFNKCQVSWFFENYAQPLEKQVYSLEETAAIPGTVFQRVWEGIINERVYGRFQSGEALIDWCRQQTKALFHTLSFEVEDQFRIERLSQRAVGDLRAIGIRGAKGAEGFQVGVVELAVYPCADRAQRGGKFVGHAGHGGGLGGGRVGSPVYGPRVQGHRLAVRLRHRPSLCPRIDGCVKRRTLRCNRAVHCGNERAHHGKAKEDDAHKGDENQ